MKRMHKTAEAIAATLDADLRLLVSPEALTALSHEPLPELDLHFIDVDIDSLPPPATPPRPPVGAHRAAGAAPAGRTLRTTIRLPRAVVDAFKREAAATGKPYQSLIVRALRDHVARAAKLGRT